MRLAMVEPQTLSAAYERCRLLHARHGRTYYLATLLLPRWKRPHIHALGGLIEQHHSGVAAQPAGDDDLLLVAARE